MSEQWAPLGPAQQAAVLKVGSAKEGPDVAAERAVGIAAFSADGRQAALIFQPNELLGDCRGILRRPVQPNLDGSIGRFRISCSKAGAATGRLHFDAETRAGTGRGIAPNRRHFDLTILHNERL